MDDYCIIDSISCESRMLSLLLFIVINFTCLQFMSHSIILFTSIYRITQQSIFILIFSIILHNWKEHYIKLFVMITSMGCFMEVFNIFYPMVTVKYCAFALVLILGSFKIAASKTPKVEYMRILLFPFNQKVMFVLLVYFVMLQVALADWIGLVDSLVSSQWRFLLLFTLFTSLQSLVEIDFFVQYSYIHILLLNCVLLLIDNFFTVWFAAFYVPVGTFYLLRFFPKMKELMHSRIPNAQKNRNYDIIVILAFCMYHINYWIGQHYTFHISYVYPSIVGGTVLFIGLIRNPRRIEEIRQKFFGKRPQPAKYDEFQSAKNDDTVL